MDNSRTEKNTKSRNVPQNIFLVKNSMNLRKKKDTLKSGVMFLVQQ